MAQSFIHLRVHSDYSLLEGATKVKDIVRLAKEGGMPAVALTDTGNLFGALEFALTASDAGIQPIMGTQIMIARVDDPAILDALVLLVKNDVGYKNLLKLMTFFYFAAPEGTDPHITIEQLKNHSDGLIALSGSIDGQIGKLLIDKKKPDAENALKVYTDIFPGFFYLELTRHGVAAEVSIEQDVLDLAIAYNIPIVATNNVHFSSADMYEAHDALICVADGQYVNEENRRRFTANHFFKSSAEMVALFEDLPEAIENTIEIAKRCAYMPKGLSPLLPKFPCKDHTEEEELKNQSLEGLEKRLNKHVFTKNMSNAEQQEKREIYQKRLYHELGIINQMGFPGYFLIVANFIQWAKSQNIPVGPGRGSGAGSLVAWSLTITDIDPIRFGLLFERFLNPERVSMPDFDIDFCQDRRDEVISYVQDFYGKDQVAQIITFGKLQARAVLRDVGRVLQMPYGQVDRICKMVPNNPANPVTLSEALEQEPMLQEMRAQDTTVTRLIGIALKLEGLYRHASTHAAGLIIGDRTLDDLVPLYRDPKSDMAVTQFNMKFVEKAGLVKFDFLGLKTLTVVEKAAEMVRQHTPGFQVATMPLDDKNTFALLNRVETTGVFQLESAGMRDVLRKLKPDQFEEIIALVALYRPGPMDDIPRYLACKHGEEDVHYMHPMLEALLKETFGVMVYQEQVMQIAQVMAGYTLGAADLLRRAMGKKIVSEMAEQRKIFVTGAIKNSVDEKLADSIFDQIAKFAGYGFNKSHSAPYGLIAYQTAYMKANFPVEFMAATMTSDMGNTDKLDLYQQELKNMNIDLLPPNINKSHVIFSVEDTAVRYGLAAIKNVGDGAMSELVSERTKNGVYKSLEDFAERLSGKVLNKRQMEHLIMSGAFDTLNPNRRQLFEAIEGIVQYGNLAQAQKNSHQKSLFGNDAASTIPPIQLAPTADWDALEKLNYEMGAFGFYLSAHPLESYEHFFKTANIIPSCDLEKSEGRTVKVAAIVTTFKERTSKAGKKFAFVSFTDKVGSFEAVFFSELLNTSRDLLTSGAPLCLSIQVRRDPERGLKMMAQSCEKLENVLKIPNHIILDLAEDTPVGEVLSLIEQQESGTQSLSLHIHISHEKIVRMRLPKTYKITTKSLRFLGNIAGVSVKYT